MLLKLYPLQNKKRLTLLLFIIIVIIIVSNTISFGQKKSDFSTFIKEKNSLTKAKIALLLSENYVLYQLDSLKILVENLTQNSKKNAFAKAIRCRILGILNVRKGDFKNGIVLLKYSKNYSLSIQDLELLTSDLNELGNAYFLKGDLKTAAFYYEASLKTGNYSPCKTDAFLAKINLARIHIQQDKISEAEQEIESYIILAKKSSKWNAVANAYAVFTDLALKQENYKLAKYYCEKNIFYVDKTMQPSSYLNAQTNKALIHFFSDEKELALELLQKNLEGRKSQNISHKIFESYYNLAGYFSDSDKKISGYYSDSCVQIAQKHKLFGLELEALEFKISILNLVRYVPDKIILIKKINLLERENKKERDKLCASILFMNNIEKKEDKNYLAVLFLFFFVLILFMGLQVKKTKG